MRTTENIIRFIRNLFYIHILFPIIGKKQKSKKHCAVICAIFKNEAKFFAEWLEYYQIVGIGHFYLYNNNSEDNYKKVLKPYIDKGIVTLIDWPEKPGQMSAYNHCIRNFGNEANWIGFIDLDEFVCPIKFDTIPEWLNKYEKYPSAYVYWRMFSSGGAIAEDASKPVIEQFTVCGDLIRSAKLFLNTEYSDLVRNFKLPHAIRFKYFGIVVPQYASLLFSLRKCIKSDNVEVQMNHYYVKSYDYFVTNKCTRGDVLKNNNTIYKPEKFFEIEKMCYKSDLHISKYLTELKLRLKLKK